MPAKLAALLCALSILASAGDSYAQFSVPSQASSADEGELLIAIGRPPVEKPKEKSLPWEVGSSLGFITSAASLGDKKLAFTDVVLLRLHALMSLGRYDLFVGNDILPKQPSYTNELVWQGALAGVRTTLGEKNSAWIRGQAGPQLDRNGYWLSAEAAAQYRLALQKELFVETSLGWSHTQLSFKEDVERLFFVEEVFAQVGVAIRDPKDGKFALWLTFDYYVPVLSGPKKGDPDPLTGGALDPQPRVNLHIGVLGGVTRNVDLFVEYSILDRGDLELARTTLPILHSGFDQKQILFGFMRHFGRERR